MYTLTPEQPNGNETSFMNVYPGQTENISLREGPYYVWIRDYGGDVSPNYSIINAVEIRKNQGTGSTLTVDVDTTSENSSKRWSDSYPRLVLQGTPVWLKVQAEPGYNSPKIDCWSGMWDRNVTGTYYINRNTTIISSATANKYKVRFNANGGSGTMADQEFTYDQLQELTPNAFTRSGYIFTGWTTNSNGTGTSYTNGQNVENLTTQNNGTVNLYAQWVNPNTAYKYMISPDTSNGTSYANNLAGALSNCKPSGSTITVLQDVTERTGGAISKSITINTNGKKLTLGGIATVSSGKTVDVVGGGTIDGGSYCPFDVTGTLNITNATIQSNASATINLENSSNVTINSGIVKSTNKNAVKFTGNGTLTIKGGEVKHENTSTDGCAIYNVGAGGTVVIEGGTISTNRTYAIQHTGILNIFGGTVSSTANAAIYQLTSDSASTTITGGEIRGAEVAISAKKGTLTIGEDDDVVDISSPVIKTDSTTRGVLDVASAATCSVYDGKFGSKNSFRLLYSTSVIKNKPSGYEVKEIGSSDGYYWGVLKYIIADYSTVYKPYTGSTITGVEDAPGYTVVSGGTSSTAGSHTAKLRLTEPDITSWSDGTTSDKNVTWYITQINDPGTIYINGTTKQVTLTKSAGSGNLEIVQEPTGLATVSLISGNTLSITREPGATGSSVVKVKENNGGYILTINIVVDATAPTVGTVEATIVNTNQLNVSVAGAADNVGGSGIAGYKVYNSSGTLQGSITTTEASATISLTANNGWYSNDYVVKAYDKAGNETTTGVGISCYKVGTVDGLRGLGMSLANSGTFENRTVKQTANINLSGISPMACSNLSSDTTAFKGIYDGQNYTISNYTINVNLNDKAISLFGWNSGTITNLNLSGFTFKNAGKGFAAGLVSKNSGIISNCTGQSINITTGTSGNAGGLVYLNEGTVENCTCGRITLKGGTNANILGGVVGSNSGTVTNCVLSGNTADAFELTSGTGSIGGIVGKNESGGSTVENCTLKATIQINTAATNVGGIVGENAGDGNTATPGVNAKVISSTTFSTGKLQSGHVIANAGGIVGNNSGDVSQCWSIVEISSLYNNLGGIIGRNSGTVSSSYNTGTLDWGNNCAYAGGIVGYNTGSIAAVYNTGNVGGSSSTGGAKVGGISGYNSGNINLAYFTGEVKAGTNNGPIHGATGSGASGTSVYYLNAPSGTYNTTGTKLQPYELKTVLGSNVEFEAAFKVDIAGNNGGYPILRWQAGAEPSEDTIYYASGSSSNSATISGNTVTFPTYSNMSAYIPSYNGNRTIIGRAYYTSVLDIVEDDKTLISLNCNSGTSKSLSNVLSANSPAWVTGFGSGQRTVNVQNVTKVVKIP